MKTIITFVVFLSFLANLTQAQIKFRVKKLNADSLASLISEKNGIEKIDALNLLSNVICRQDFDSSIHLANQAILLSEKLNYRKGLADGYFNVGNIYFLLDKLEPTIANYLKAYRIYEDLEPSQEFGNLCIQLALMNYITGRYDDVFKYAHQALYTFNKTNDKEWTIITMMVLGELNLFITKEYDSVIFYYNKALAMFDPVEEQNDMVFTHDNIGEFYRLRFIESGDTSYLNKSLEALYKATEYQEINPESKAYTYLQLGESYIQFGTKSALATGVEYLKKVDLIADSCFDAYEFKSFVFKDLGWVSHKQGDYNKAIYYYKKNIKIIEERLSVFSINSFRHPALAYNWRMYVKYNNWESYEGLYKIYTELGDYKTALEYYILSKKAEEEIYQEKNKNLITMMEAVSKDDKTKSQIDLLARDNELKALAIRQFRIFVFGIAGIFIVLLLIGLLFIRQNKMKNEHKTLALEQKLFRLQMNPHFIFNALSNILNFIDGKENEKASNYLTTFSKLLRTTLETTRTDLVPFEKEVSNLKNYLELQKLRYGNKFDYAVEVDNNIDAEDMSIPPMLVQPFIENAIEHGIRHKKTPGRIDVRFLLKGRKILCEIEDDGVGRAKAWETEVAERNGHKSLATEIIKDRIKSLNKKFKQKIELQITDKISENAEAMGTKVLLDLPYGSVYE